MTGLTITGNIPSPIGLPTATGMKALQLPSA
jgi:hypothetical protein